MKFALKTDKVLTVLYTIICIFLFIVIGIAAYNGFHLMNSAAGFIDNSTAFDGSGFNDGYVVILDLIAGGASGSIGLLLLAISILFGLYAVILLIVLIFAYIGLHNYKTKGTIKSIKHNLIVKLIYSGIQTIWLIVNTIQNEWNPFYSVLFSIITLFSLFALYTLQREPVLINTQETIQ